MGSCLFCCFRKRPKDNLIHISIVVLGELAQSPRMLNHARSALSSNSNIAVDLIGMATRGIEQIGFDNPRLRVYPIRANPACLDKLKSIFWPLYAILRIVLITLYLLWILLIKTPTPSYMLMQNPPTFPVLPALILSKWIRGATLAIDWHNFGYTILQVNRRGRIPVYISKIFEKRLSYFADLHYCVSRAMQQFLQTEFQRRAQVVYDLKTKKFNPKLSVSQLHELYLKYDCTTKPDQTFKTEKSENRARLRDQRPLIAITSTSFTPDQDFGLLLRTLDQLSVRLSFLDESISLSKFGDGPKFILFITGRGPQKAFYQEQIKKRAWQNEWKALFLWIDTQDYPLFVKSADVGICLHASSSGLDLPMKVVDLFSAGVPVFAKKYKTQENLKSSIGQLVKREVNGKLFETHEQLAEMLFVRLTPKSRNRQCNVKNWIAQVKELAQHLGRQIGTNNGLKQCILTQKGVIKKKNDSKISLKSLNQMFNCFLRMCLCYFIECLDLETSFVLNHHFN